MKLLSNKSFEGLKSSGLNLKSSFLNPVLNGNHLKLYLCRLNLKINYEFSQEVKYPSINHDNKKLYSLTTDFLHFWSHIVLIPLVYKTWQETRALFGFVLLAELS